jgi:hypothetical protein
VLEHPLAKQIAHVKLKQLYRSEITIFGIVNDKFRGFGHVEKHMGFPSFTRRHVAPVFDSHTMAFCPTFVPPVQPLW